MDNKRLDDGGFYNSFSLKECLHQDGLKEQTGQLLRVTGQVFLFQWIFIPVNSV